MGTGLNAVYRLREIEMNKCPPGTRILDDYERRDILRNLKAQEKSL
jgi:hypothetical protein